MTCKDIALNADKTILMPTSYKYFGWHSFRGSQANHHMIAWCVHCMVVLEQTLIAGDILGTLLDMKTLQITFYLNGEPLPPSTQVFQNAK